MAAPIQPIDLQNAKQDTDHIAAIATSTALTATDRLGQTKRTLAGVDAYAQGRVDTLVVTLDSEVQQTIDTTVQAATVALGNLGYLPPEAYAAGIVLSATNQTVSQDGIVYAPLLSALPFTTSGLFEMAKFRVVQSEFAGISTDGNLTASAGWVPVPRVKTILDDPDATLNAQAQALLARMEYLGTGAGPGKLGFVRSAVADLVESTIQPILNSVEVSILEFLDSVSKPTADDPTTWDWTSAFQTAQAAIVALGGGTLKIPRGTYYLSGNGIQTATNASYYTLSPVVRFLGEGTGTVISRRETLATDVIDFSNPGTFHASAFNIHAGNVCVENIVVENCKSAFYLGQKNGEVDTCSVAFCRFKNIWVRNCGVALHMRSGVGNYYNTFSDWHVYQCQVGEYLDSHPTSATQIANNNRNQFRQFRNARCHVGLWIKRGDTNQFFGHHNEGNTAAPTNNRYAAPTGLPYSLPSGVAQLLETNALNNFFAGCMNENNVVDLCNGGERNSFNGLYNDEVSGRVRHIVRPHFYSTRTMSVTNSGQTFYFSNPQGDIFSGYSAGRVHSDAPTENHAPELNIVGAATRRSDAIDLGAVASAAVVNYTLWPETELPVTSSKSARFDVKILGTVQATPFAISTSFTVLALRNSARTITRYFIYDTVSGRATGSGTGDSAEPFVPSLSVGGAGGKDLILSITAPARVFDGVGVSIDRVMR